MLCLSPDFLENRVMRKSPQQQRSKQMVNTLLEATAKCIALRGLDNTSTPAIAEMAGVSVGSLYQYFDGKEALLAALLNKLALDVGTTLKHIPLSEGIALRTLIEQAIDMGFSLLNSSDGLYLELVRNWHRLPTEQVADVLQQHFSETARMYFIKHYHQYPIVDLQARLFIIINSTLFTMVRLASQQHESLLSEKSVRDGLVNMIVGYLEQV